MTFKPNIFICETPEELTSRACKTIIDIIHASKPENWPLSIALSGGSTPKALYKCLHDEHLQLLRDTRPLRFFFGDERMVDANDDDSNYKMARLALLRDIPDDLVVPIHVEYAGGGGSKDDCSKAMKAADAYEKRIGSLLQLQKVEFTDMQEVPLFDIVLLGLGSDGHTASIFPGSQAENEKHRAVSVGFPSPTMSPKVWRVTLTSTTIVYARHVILLASGREKKWVLNGIMTDTCSKPPVSRFIRNCKGEVTFILDKDIAEDIAV